MLVMIQKLIGDRKQRLNSIQAKFMAKELLNIMWFGNFLHDSIRKVDQRAVEDNEETDRALKELDLVYVDGLAEVEDGFYNLAVQEAVIL